MRCLRQATEHAMDTVMGRMPNRAFIIDGPMHPRKHNAFLAKAREEAKAGSRGRTNGIQQPSREMVITNRLHR